MYDERQITRSYSPAVSSKRAQTGRPAPKVPGATDFLYALLILRRKRPLHEDKLVRSFPLFIVAIMVCLTPAAARAQKLNGSPSRNDFGKVRVGKSVSFSFLLENPSGRSITVLSKSIRGKAFSFGNFPVPVKIGPKSSLSLPVIFTPTAGGETSGDVTIKSDAENSTLRLDLKGKGADEAGAQLAVSPASLSFGNVAVGSNSTLQATLTASNAAVTISSDTSTNSVFTILGVSLPVTVKAGQSLPVTIQFSPSASGTTSGKAQFTSNAVNSPTIEGLTGTGVAQKNRQLTISPPTLDFGNVSVGSSASLPATLTAPDAAVTISSDQASSEFAILGLKLPVTINAGQSLPITIQFTPSASGAAAGQAQFISNAEDSPTNEALSGTGVGTGSHSVSLSWDPGDGKAVGYNIYRSTTQSGSYEMINSALDSSADYTDSTVVSGTTYYYVATEVNDQGQESPYSNVAKAVIPR